MRRILIFSVVLAAVGFGCLLIGERGARSLERLMLDRVGNGLAAIGIDWAELHADGLRLDLRGHAPDIYAHDLALETARATAPYAKVIDHSTATLAPPIRRDPLRIELLRDSDGLTLTGRFAGEAMRGRLIASLTAASPGLAIHDLTGVNAERPGSGWGPELDIAVAAAVMVPNAYVTVEPGAVRVEGLARGASQRQEIGDTLMALVGETVRLTLELHEPLRVVTPFVFSVNKEVSGAFRLELCSSRDSEEEAEIEALLNRFQVAGPARRCPAALGGPGTGWAAAAEAGLNALARLPAGRFRLEYRTAQLTGSGPTGAQDLEPALAALASALPPGYGLIGALPDANAAMAAAVPAPQRHWITIGRLQEGVVLAGTVSGEAAARMLEAYAAARFGGNAVHAMLSAGSGGAPPGWNVAAMVALDAVAGLIHGEAEVTPGRIGIRGLAATPAQAARLHRLLEGEAPEGYAVTSELSIDLPAQVAEVPLGIRRCATLLGQMVKDDPITFAPGSAVLEGRSNRVLDRLATLLRRCESGSIEIGGHTDSQGSDSLNLRLSTARAEAVLDGLLERGVPLARMSARGYGDAMPVAENSTEAGRALNRRIEFVAIE